VTDLALTPRGEKQAAALRGLFAAIHPRLVLSSPRRRALDTADLAGVNAEVDDDLAEWNYGEYEGLTSAEIRRSVPGWTLFADGAPGGETAEQVAERADRVLARVRAQLDDGPVVLVGHGHFSRVLGARWLGLPPAAAANLLLDAAALCLLSAQYGVPAIKLWNLPNPENSLDLEGDR
jgi:probable phosphoglycerate mutase